MSAPKPTEPLCLRHTALRRPWRLNHRIEWKSLFVIWWYKECTSERKGGPNLSRSSEDNYDDGNRLLPRIIMAKNYFQDLCSPWNDALVIKLLGNIGYLMMKERLRKLWRLQGGFEIMDVDNGFYMVKCDLPMDKEKIMSDGQWMIFDHYLAMSQWTPDFASLVALVEKTMVWIRFPGRNLLSSN